MMNNPALEGEPISPRSRSDGVSIGIGLYGTNGHQVHGRMSGLAHVHWVATAAFPETALTPALRAPASVRHYAGLDDLLADPDVELVVLCSPCRRRQAAEAIRCLQAGKHVYAEKPCAMTEADLDGILKAVAETGCSFREMAGTTLVQPYLAMRDVVQQGRIGTVVQVLAQKSYPYHDARPQDEDIDGGLICQNAIHAVRFVEWVGGVRITAITGMETSLGNPKPGGLRMAASLAFTLENGGVGSIIANYLNPRPGFGAWGNEMLRIFGTSGFVEAVDGGKRTRLVLPERDGGPLDVSAPDQDHFALFLASILKTGQMPWSLEDELHATRVVIRARNAVRSV